MIEVHNVNVVFRCPVSLKERMVRLAEAQDLLGKLAWPASASVERLSGEYWQLTDLDVQQKRPLFLELKPQNGLLLLADLIHQRTERI